MITSNEESTPMLAAGSRIGEYDLIRYVTSGAMSEVYEGRRAGSETSVAVKILHLDLCLYPTVVTRFLNEALALEALKHERIIALFAWGRLPEKPPFMVLEWLPCSLEQALERAGGPLELAVAARIAAQIAEATATMHDRGIVHRDLKPANILLTEGDLGRAEIKLADFGLIKVLGKKTGITVPGAMAPIDVYPLSTAGSDLLGTCEYMAPEQWIQSKNVDARADVYSLGVLLFQMITGELPFQAVQPKDWMALHTLRTPPLHRLDGLTPLPLRDLIARMLSKKIAPRPTMREVMSELALVQ